MNEFLPKNALVTGGAGFIGSNFIRYMLSMDHTINIINLDALTYASSLSNLASVYDEDRYKFVEGDICDKNLVEQLLRKNNINLIVHFAAESHVDRSISGPAVFIQTNLIGTFTLLEAGRKYWFDQYGLDSVCCRFHHISTDEVYGTLDSKGVPFTETSPYKPNSPYSASKAGSDHLVRAYFQTYKLPVSTTYCSNNYGPYQHKEKFIPTIIRSCLGEKTIPIYGDGSNIRDWLYVDDHCSAIDKVIRKGRIGESYNIGGNNEWANSDIARLICHMMNDLAPHKSDIDYVDLISFVKDRPGHDWRYALNTDKIETELLWKPRETFETGIRKTIEWYLSHLEDKGAESV